MTQSKLILNTILTTALLASGTGLSWTSGASLSAVQAAPTTTVSTNNNPAQSASVPLLSPKWQAKADGLGLYDTQAPVANGLVYYSVSGTLKAADLDTGKVKWSYKYGSHPEVVTASSVFLIDLNGYLVKLQAKTGKVLWKVKAAKTPIVIGAYATLLNDVLYVTNESGGIAAYHPDSGKKIWADSKLPMYASDIVGQHGGVLVVYSTVDNTRTQFFGLDAASGKKLWRLEGVYSTVSFNKGQLTLRQDADPTAKAPVKGYLATLVTFNTANGKITKQENFQPLSDIRRLGSYYTVLQDNELYTVDGNLDSNEAVLTRIKRGQENAAAIKSYAEYGQWLAGPINGTAYFHKDGQLTGLNLGSDKTVKFSIPATPGLHLQISGKAVFAGAEDGYLYIMNAATGKTLGRVKTGAQEYGTIFVKNGAALVQTDTGLLAVALPKELQ
ncbi:outer membrane protein assembly factor BamB family protein [Paenibacillus sp. TH7-28]